MKIIFSIIVAAILFFSCTTQKETIKQREEKPIVQIEKKKELIFSFEMQKSKTSSSLRGISVVDSLTAWASGSNGTYLRTTDGGKSWKRKYMNRDPKVFFDRMSFWNKKEGIAVSDPIDDNFYPLSINYGQVCISCNKIPTLSASSLIPTVRHRYKFQND